MNWEAMGAIGEVVGALAVVATLVYFGIQLRATTRVAEASNLRGVADSFNFLGLELAKNPDLRRVYGYIFQLNSIDELSDEDQLILELVLRSIFNNVHAGVHSSELYGIDPSTVPDRNQGLAWITRSLLSYPIVREWWKQSPLADNSYGPNFENVINASIEKHESADA